MSDQNLLYKLPGILWFNFKTFHLVNVQIVDVMINIMGKN